MTRWSQEDVDRLNAERGVHRQKNTPPKSKYRNIKIVIDGEKFDSKREAHHWAELKLREKSGEISGVARQVAFALWAPSNESSTASVQIATYVSDFTFYDRDGRQHVVDVKGGKETAMFALKRKWLFLQSGIEIEVVR